MNDNLKISGASNHSITERETDDYSGLDISRKIKGDNRWLTG